MQLMIGNKKEVYLARRSFYTLAGSSLGSIVCRELSSFWKTKYKNCKILFHLPKRLPKTKYTVLCIILALIYMIMSFDFI